MADSWKNKVEWVSSSHVFECPEAHLVHPPSESVRDLLTDEEHAAFVKSKPAWSMPFDLPFSTQLNFHSETEFTEILKNTIFSDIRVLFVMPIDGSIIETLLDIRDDNAQDVRDDNLVARAIQAINNGHVVVSIMYGDDWFGHSQWYFLRKGDVWLVAHTEKPHYNDHKMQ